jgi:hypothetical protein
MIAAGPGPRRVAYAVLSLGSVPGMGEKLSVVPFEALKLDATREHFTLDVDKDKLKNAPSFDKRNPPKASDRTWGAEISPSPSGTPSCATVARPRRPWAPSTP